MSNKNTVKTARCCAFLDSAEQILHSAWTATTDPAALAKIVEAVNLTVEARTLIEQKGEVANHKPEPQTTPSIWTLTVKDAKGTVPAITKESVQKVREERVHNGCTCSLHPIYGILCDYCLSKTKGCEWG